MKVKEHLVAQIQTEFSQKYSPSRASSKFFVMVTFLHMK